MDMALFYYELLYNITMSLIKYSAKYQKVQDVISLFKADKLIVVLLSKETCL